MSESSDLLTRVVYAGLVAARQPVAAGDGTSPTRRIVSRLAANALGAGRRENAPILDALAPADPHGRYSALALGTLTSTPEQAAAANAAAITMGQCDEGLRESRGHAGLHAFAAALAMVEHSAGTFGQLLEAVSAGWEIGARLGLVLGLPRSGVHPHGGWGAGAAAAAAAVALGLDDELVVSAVANAMTVALAGPDSSTYAGQNSHFLLPALGTAGGVTAARLTEAGMRPPVGALEHFASIAYRTPPDSARIEEYDGQALTALAYFKPVGLCAHALTSWESAVDLRREVDAGAFDLAEIEQITVRSYAGASLLSDQRPTTSLGRQFSMPWAVASGLAGSAPASDGGAVVARLAAITRVEHDPSLDAGYPSGRPSYLTVKLHSGSTIERFAEFHNGDRERPFDAREYAAIDARLLAEADDPARAERDYRRFDQPETAPLHDQSEPQSSTTQIDNRRGGTNT